MADRAPVTDHRGALRSAGAFVLLLAVAGATIVVAVNSLLPARENLHRTRARVATEQLRNDALEEQVNDLREEIVLIETDAWTNLQILRNEHGLSEPGEIKVE